MGFLETILSDLYVYSSMLYRSRGEQTYIYLKSRMWENWVPRSGWDKHSSGRFEDMLTLKNPEKREKCYGWVWEHARNCYGVTRHENNGLVHFYPIYGSPMDAWNLLQTIKARADSEGVTLDDSFLDPEDVISTPERETLAKAKIKADYVAGIKKRIQSEPELVKEALSFFALSDDYTMNDVLAVIEKENFEALSNADYSGERAIYYDVVDKRDILEAYLEIKPVIKARQEREAQAAADKAERERKSHTERASQEQKAREEAEKQTFLDDVTTSGADDLKHDMPEFDAETGETSGQEAQPPEREKDREVRQKDKRTKKYSPQLEAARDRWKLPNLFTARIVENRYLVMIDNDELEPKDLAQINDEYELLMEEAAA